MSIIIPRLTRRPRSPSFFFPDPLFVALVALVALLVGLAVILWVW
jgi:hypothetical protein